MNICSHIRSIILTDYVDKELDAKTAERIEGHLQICQECRSLAEKVRTDMALIFGEHGRKEAPIYLWRAIKNRIEETHSEIKAQGYVKSFFNRLTLLKLVPALAAIVLLIFIGSFLLYNHYATRPVEEDYGYVMDVLESGESLTGIQNSGLGTPIEEYFL